MNGDLKESDIVGRTIVRVLQTSWEDSDGYEFTRFVLELDDGALYEFDQFEPFLSHVDADDDSLSLMPADDEGFGSASGADRSPLGERIESVIVTDKRPGMGALFLALSGELWLERTSEERGESLLVWDKEGFIEHIANCFEFFDYWTRDPVVMYGMKAVDFILTLSGIEVRTMESVDGQCTNVFVGPLVDRRVARLNTGFRCYPQGGNKWKGRLVDVRPGKNRVWLVMCPSKCWKDIEIDDSVLTQGVLQVELNEQDVHGNEDWPESM